MVDDLPMILNVDGMNVAVAHSKVTEGRNPLTDDKMYRIDVRFPEIMALSLPKAAAGIGAKVNAVKEKLHKALKNELGKDYKYATRDDALIVEAKGVVSGMKMGGKIYQALMDLKFKNPQLVNGTPLDDEKVKRGEAILQPELKKTWDPVGRDFSRRAYRLTNPEAQGVSAEEAAEAINHYARASNFEMAARVDGHEVYIETTHTAFLEMLSDAQQAQPISKGRMTVAPEVVAAKPLPPAPRTVE